MEEEVKIITKPSEALGFKDGEVFIHAKAGEPRYWVEIAGVRCMAGFFDLMYAIDYARFLDDMWTTYRARQILANLPKLQEKDGGGGGSRTRDPP